MCIRDRVSTILNFYCVIAIYFNETDAVSYTHLDVYKRQVIPMCNKLKKQQKSPNQIIQYLTTEINNQTFVTLTNSTQIMILNKLNNK